MAPNPSRHSSISTSQHVSRFHFVCRRNRKNNLIQCLLLKCVSHSIRTGSPGNVTGNVARLPDCRMYRFDYTYPGGVTLANIQSRFAWTLLIAVASYSILDYDYVMGRAGQVVPLSTVSLKMEILLPSAGNLTVYPAPYK